MLEAKIEKAVGEYAKRHGGTPYKFTSPGRRQVPDRLYIFPKGLLFFIEFKATGKVPTAGQLREHDKLRKLGQDVYVIDSIESGKQLIDFMLLDL